MNYRRLYDKYQASWLTVYEYRRRGFFHKHLFSLPCQLAKRYYGSLVLNKVRALNRFPDLAVEGDPSLVVSLTTFPYRFPRLYLVIRSLLAQDRLPGRICIWLSEDEFPDGADSIYPELRELMRYGVEIGFVRGNMRAHKKYYYAFERYPDKNIITVDDDCVYPPDIISRLCALHEQFPDAVCANMAVMTPLVDDCFVPFRQWERLGAGIAAESLFFTAFGYGGVFYPAHVYDKTVLDIDLIRQLAPLADDLWLKAVQLKLGVKVASSQQMFVHPVKIPGTQKIRLMKHNEGRNMNDVQWDALDKHFGLRNILAQYAQAANSESADRTT